ncbi:substrate-binding domain-containing protein [Fodinibius halophilus]|uniref:Phosphate ABC transporter substrate-binding protein n=1 Tax=Fodinibius halophilus TaxID=1736908 RepID=A0A6M1T1H6_9BACT|nr:substrate-binding domain-containing protein [Fodinibius halophilus]NGP87847.1 phosphate ABC transporter substrate-binding protein [Fodinibius halophilus]
MKNIITTLLGVFLIAFATEATAQSYKVIVNSANSTESISKKNLSEIFLKNKTKWDDGSSISPVDLKSSSATRKAFSNDVLGRDVGAIRSYWQQAAFSGKGTAPVERSSDAEVITFVKNNPGAVGYISESTDASGVKVLTIN